MRSASFFTCSPARQGLPMLETCFLHLPGIGPAFEAKLRDNGIHCWEDATKAGLPCSPAKAESLRQGLAESRVRLDAGDACWFGDRLASREQWRLFPHFRHTAAYVDIETTGLSPSDSAITTIALFDGNTVRTYVQGENLQDFADDIRAYKLLVTWNGRSFDAPFLRRSLGIPLDHGDMAHLDLLPVFRGLGLRGGLKKVEEMLGLDRQELAGVDGMTAVRLWWAYKKSKERRFLETLLAYNAADVLSLEYLAEYALCRQTALQGLPPLPEPAPAKLHLNPFVADPAALRAVGVW